MIMRSKLGRSIVLVASLLLVTSCARKEGPEEAPKKKAPAKKALEEEIPLQAKIEGSGYKVVSYDRFPAQEQGLKGRVLVYKSSGGTGGGVIYFKKRGERILPAWHWYFEELSPDSVQRIEINEDGLWDMRIFAEKDEQLDFVQMEDFTLFAPMREWLLAMNGHASENSSGAHALWKCFDGDSATAWRASTNGPQGAYIELAVPFGVEEGILLVRTMEKERPRSIEALADGRKIGKVSLENKQGIQRLRLDPAVQGAKRVRLVFPDSYDEAGFVSIAELDIK